MHSDLWFPGEWQKIIWWFRLEGTSASVLFNLLHKACCFHLLNTAFLRWSSVLSFMYSQACILVYLVVLLSFGTHRSHHSCAWRMPSFKLSAFLNSFALQELLQMGSHQQAPLVNQNLLRVTSLHCAPLPLYLLRVLNYTSSCHSQSRLPLIITCLFIHWRPPAPHLEIKLC